MLPCAAMRSSGRLPEEVRHVSRKADSAYLFCLHAQYKPAMLSQHFVTHVVPPRCFVGNPVWSVYLASAQLCDLSAQLCGLLGFCNSYPGIQRVQYVPICQ